MALTYLALADHIKAILDGIASVGVVYNIPKDFRDIDEIEEECVSGTPPRLNVWFIKRTGVRNSLRVSDGRPVPLGTGARIHDFQVEGWYGFIPDAATSTELVFQNMLTDLANEFQGKKQRRLSGDSPFILDTDEITLTSEIDKFVDAYVAHHVIFNITFTEMYEVTYL